MTLQMQRNRLGAYTLELICCLLNLATAHQVSKPYSSSLTVQICIVHICGGTMAGKYTKELKWHTITVLENLWVTRSLQVPVECF